MPAGSRGDSEEWPPRGAQAWRAAAAAPQSRAGPPAGDTRRRPARVADEGGGSCPGSMQGQTVDEATKSPPCPSRACRYVRRRRQPVAVGSLCRTVVGRAVVVVGACGVVCTALPSNGAATAPFAVAALGPVLVAAAVLLAAVALLARTPRAPKTGAWRCFASTRRMRGIPRPPSRIIPRPRSTNSMIQWQWLSIFICAGVCYIKKLIYKNR